MHRITLDRERDLRFDYQALIALEECGVNVWAGDMFKNMSPRLLRDFVWAGQLHTKAPLAKERVAAYLPTSPEGFGKVCEVVVAALSDAMSDDKK